MIVDFWEKSGERNERIAAMIYAMRHIDDGLSMCNIKEVEKEVEGKNLNIVTISADEVRDYANTLRKDEESQKEAPYRPRRSPKRT